MSVAEPWRPADSQTEGEHQTKRQLKSRSERRERDTELKVNEQRFAERRERGKVDREGGRDLPL